jgi:NTE family protein
MKKPMAFVLSGGGARAALQVGALRALFEAGYRPDILVGTSAGAINAAFMGVWGVDLAGVDRLEKAWQEVEPLDLLPANYLWLTIRALFNRPTGYYANRIRDFLISNGLAPELRFGDVQGIRLVIVAADLNASEIALYGQDLDQSLLEAVLASTALPPWMAPVFKDGRYLVDGGAVSTLPVEPAIKVGASEIIALDLCDSRSLSPEAQGFGPFFAKLLNTVEHRQFELEMELAAARRVPVRRILLCWDQPVPIWDFQHTRELISCGYETTQREIAAWQAERSPWQRLRGWLFG